MIFLKILNNQGEIKLSEKGYFIKSEYLGELNEGDKIQIHLDGANAIAVQFDDSLQESFLYLPNKSFTFTIPSKRDLQMGYNPQCFQGNRHLLFVREADDEEFYALRNIALNSHDLRRKTGGYPHASANFVTREEPCFYERNAIDGEKNNQGHGSYPFHSWAGGARNDLEYTLDFGREVEIEKLVFYLRADFVKDTKGEPHDSYWKSIDIQFDDGEVITGEFVMDRTVFPSEENEKGQ